MAFEGEDGWKDVVVWIVDMLFFADIFVNLSSPIYIHGQQITDRVTIAKNYLKLEFWIDILASVPFDRCPRPPNAGLLPCSSSASVPAPTCLPWADPPALRQAPVCTGLQRRCTPQAVMPGFWHTRASCE